MALDWLIRTAKRLWGSSDDQPYYRNPISPLIRAWAVSEAEAWRVVGTYARMAGTDDAGAIEQLEYLDYEEALMQIGER